MDFWSQLWDVIWWFITAFIFITALFAVIAVVIDLFRDKSLKGWHKALWIVALVFFPLVSAIIYLLVRGRGMGERSETRQREAREASAEYIRSVARSSPTEEIAQAKQLLDTGAVTAEEFESLKARALRQSARMEPV